MNDFIMSISHQPFLNGVNRGGLMARLHTLMITLLLLVIPLIGAQAQTPTQAPPPPQLEQAVSGLGSLLGVPLTVNDLDSWQASQDVYTDSALGCPYVYGQPIPGEIAAYTFKLGYQGLIYDYRVSVDGTLAFPCIRDGGGPLGDTPTPQSSNCPAGYAGYLAPRLQVGGQAQLIAGETPNRLRMEPSVNAQQIGLIQPGDMVYVIGEPSCDEASQIVWWKVGDMAVAGWTAEGQLPNHYFLMPIEVATPSPSATLTPRFQIVPIGSPVFIVGTPTPMPRLQIALPGHLGIITPTPNVVIHR
jgi:hypothetical protein